MNKRFLLLMSGMLLAVSFGSAANADNKTGFYVGSQVSYAAGTTAAQDGGFPSADIDYSGMLVGLTFGYNHRINNFVVGAEIDYSLGDVSGSGDGGPGWACTASGTIDICTFGVTQLTTVRARFGYAIGSILPYVTAGISAGKTFGELAGGCPDTTWCGGDRPTGMVYGIGGEYSFNPHMSAKAEILKVDLGTSTLGTAGGVPLGFQADFNFLAVRAGLNYQF